MSVRPDGAERLAPSTTSGTRPASTVRAAVMARARTARPHSRPRRLVRCAAGRRTGTARHASLLYGGCPSAVPLPAVGRVLAEAAPLLVHALSERSRSSRRITIVHSMRRFIRQRLFAIGEPEP